MTDAEFTAQLDGHIKPGAYDHDLGKKPLDSLKTLDPDSRNSLLTAALAQLHVNHNDNFTHRVRRLANDLLRTGGNTDHSLVANFIEAQASQKYPFACLPLAGLVEWAEHQETSGGLSVRLLTCLRKHLPTLKMMGMDKEYRSLMHRLEVAVKLVDGWVIPGVRDSWTAIALAKRDTLPPESRDLWVSLIELAAQQNSSKPGKAYLRDAGKMADALNEFEPIMHEILESLGRDGPVCVQRFGFPTSKKQVLDDDYTSPLRALLWLCIPHNTLDVPLRAAAERCLVKIKGFGPLSAKIASTCAYVLSQQDTLSAARSVLQLQTSTKHKSTRKSLGKAIANVESRIGLNRDELAETTVPFYGFSNTHPPGVLVANQTVQLVVSYAGQPQLVVSEDPERQNARQTRSEEAKALLREIRRTWRQEVLRLERLMCSGRSVSAGVWREYYVNHPITGLICRRLLWKIGDTCLAFKPATDGTGGRDMVRLDGTPLEPGAGDLVRLWHPAELDKEDLGLWEHWILNCRILQPFQQAQRAVFRHPGDARNQTDDVRLAGDRIHQGAFAALCRERAWNYSFHGGKEEHEPFHEFPGSDLRAALKVDYTNEASWLKIAGLRFYAGKSETPLPLAQVPPISFSEAMRDIDLFISASKVKEADWKNAIPDDEKE